jgi:hypothetical protein
MKYIVMIFMNIFILDTILFSQVIEYNFVWNDYFIDDNKGGKKQFIIDNKYFSLRTENQNNYFLNDIYRDIFNISKSITMSRSNEFNKFKSLNKHKKDNFNNLVLDLSKLNCNQVLNKQFNDIQQEFILCPLQNFKLDNQILNLIDNTFVNVLKLEKNNEKYSYLKQDNIKNIIDNIFNICSVVVNNNINYQNIQYNKETEIFSEILYVKKANYCTDINKKNDIINFINNNYNVYHVRFRNYIVESLVIGKCQNLITESDNMEWSDEIGDIMFDISYYIFVDKNENYIVSDYNIYISLYSSLPYECSYNSYN